MEYTPEKPLYVVAIGAITNVASALLMRPEIKERMVLVWLGGNSLEWPDNKEFNLFQDVAAARVVFGCGVALVQLPCMGVVSSLPPGRENWKCSCAEKTSCAIIWWIIRKKKARWEAKTSCWTRVIWDVTAVAWLLDESFMEDKLIPSPIPQYDHRYSFDPTRHFIRYVYHINRDNLFEDLFRKLAES